MCADSMPPGAMCGWRVALTGAAERDHELAAAIAARGGIPLVHPLIACEPVSPSPGIDTALARLAEYQWVIFTSAAAVEHFERLYRCAGDAALPRLATVGPATARAARAMLREPALVSTAQTGQGLAAEMLAAGCGGPVLLPAADIAYPRLAQELRAAGVAVDVLTVYRTIPGPGAPDLAAAIEARAVDVILLASPSAARALAGVVAVGRELPPVVCIGPSTREEAARVGLDVAAVAVRHDRPGLLQALLEWIELHPELRHAATS